MTNLESFFWENRSGRKIFIKQIQCILFSLGMIYPKFRRNSLISWNSASTDWLVTDKYQRAWFPELFTKRCVGNSQMPIRLKSRYNWTSNYPNFNIFWINFWKKANIIFFYHNQYYFRNNKEQPKYHHHRQSTGLHCRRYSPPTPKKPLGKQHPRLLQKQRKKERQQQQQQQQPLRLLLPKMPRQLYQTVTSHILLHYKRNLTGYCESFIIYVKTILQMFLYSIHY